MKNKKILLLGSSVLSLPLAIIPIVSCSEVEEEYMDACNSELGFFFNNRGCIYGYEGPNLDGTWNDQKVVTVPEYLEVTSPKSSPILGKKYKIKEINPQGRILGFSPETQLWAWTNLEKIILPDSIERIGYHTFEGSKLSDINWPKNLLSIYDRAFSNTSLTTIVFPPSVEYIGIGAFSEIKTLKSIKFSNPKSLACIDSGAFSNCSQLEGELDFTNASSLSEIYPQAFQNTNITKVILPKKTKYVKNDPEGYGDSFPENCVVQGGIPTSYQDIMNDD